ncbi:ubiquinol-cytochrome c reductase iron-sulfur subunit [Conexibacter arvalis]|uniref:Cytochrome bc1 complex Rieske iron-sulfur subunit n=1 Tax=Conexibacter arvalis TaxID=912552 RepID=A0A840ICD7_9ACTN|nr:Rieske 2Fe-2S domain-containing protein [Conexibacter arvalis]MBB4662392.1 ubiquinol-cytochrome c reductase iron-sulfur subunit [Conexibacter arvalis]
MSESRLRIALAWIGLRLLRRLRPRRRAQEPPAPRRAEPPDALARETPSTPRAELLVAALLLVGALAAAAFVVLYVVRPDTQLLGLCLGGALVICGIAAAFAGKRVVPQETASEPYEQLADERKVDDVGAIVREAGEGVSRRGMLAAAAGLAGATIGAAAVVPVASLGPAVGDRITATPWRRGRRLVDSEGRPLRPEQITEGTVVLAFPEAADRNTLDAPVMLLRFAPEELEMSAARRAAAPGGVIAYSRICTHASCAVSMYRHPLHPATAPEPALVCPCHFSTFDPRRGGAVLFGPAGRPLPQLPLQVNAAGELVAAGGFIGQVGPSYAGERETEA